MIRKLPFANSWNSEKEANLEDRKREKALVKKGKARQLAAEVDQITFKENANKSKRRRSLVNDLLPVPGKMAPNSMYYWILCVIFRSLCSLMALQLLKSKKFGTLASNNILVCISKEPSCR